MNVLVLDVGTSSMRGILMSHLGEVLAGRQYLYQVTYLENSWVEQDPQDWVGALTEILTDVAAQAKEKNVSIDAITMTAQRSSAIPMDENIKPLTRAIMWQDKRTNQICQELEAQNDRIFQLCGARVNPVFTGCKMTWIRENQPEVYAKTYKFMVIPDYLNYIMTGRICTDDTFGSRTNLMNLHTKQWDDELLEMFRVEKEKLVPIVETGTVIGHLTKEFAGKTGCPAGIPVLSSGGDQQCGAIGQGVVREGVISVTAGTGGFLVTAVNQVPENLKSDVICNCSSVKGQYILESSVLTCCSAFDWFCRTFYENGSYEVVNRELEQSPLGANNCLCIPYFQGRSTPDWNNEAKGVFANITLNTRKCDLLRSLLEGICYELGNGVETMKAYVPLTDIYINGGLTNSDPFNDMQCNVYGTKVIRRGKTDATARGALIVALMGLGVYKTAEEAFEVLSKNGEEKVYEPDPEKIEAYRVHREEMNRMYQELYVK